MLAFLFALLLDEKWFCKIVYKIVKKVEENILFISIHFFLLSAFVFNCTSKGIFGLTRFKWIAYSCWRFHVTFTLTVNFHWISFGGIDKSNLSHSWKGNFCMFHRAFIRQLNKFNLKFINLFTLIISLPFAFTIYIFPLRDFKLLIGRFAFYTKGLQFDLQLKWVKENESTEVSEKREETVTGLQGFFYSNPLIHNQYCSLDSLLFIRIWNVYWKNILFINNQLIMRI